MLWCQIYLTAWWLLEIHAVYKSGNSRAMKNVFVIAEIGVNHNGSMRLAKRLIDAAQKAGAAVEKAADKIAN